MSFAPFGYLPKTVVAADDEIQAKVVKPSLSRRDIGFTNARLFVEARLTAKTHFWPREKRLGAVACDLGPEAQLSYDPLDSDRLRSSRRFTSKEAVAANGKWQC